MCLRCWSPPHCVDYEQHHAEHEDGNRRYEQRAAVALALVQNLHPQRGEQVEKHRTAHYRRGHEPADAVEAHAHAFVAPQPDFGGDPKQRRQQQHEGSQQFETAHHVGTERYEQSADAVAEDALHPFADGAEYVLGVRVAGEFIEQGSEKHLAYPKRDCPTNHRFCGLDFFGLIHGAACLSGE